jgi:hypothetical protein
LLGRALIVALSGVAGFVMASQDAVAQEAGNETRLMDEREVGHDYRSLWREYSYFRLFGEGDRAVTSLKSKGTTPYGRGMENFVTNTGIVDAADLNMDTQPDLARPGGRSGQYFDVAPNYGAPRSEWARFVTVAPSLANATGGGYAVSRNFPTLGLREILASDFEFGNAYSGVQSTDAGGCRDQTADALSNIAAGNTLLAGSDCPETWPLVSGVPTFKGRRKITADVWAATQAAQGSEFNFDWWRVDPDLEAQGGTFGDFQTYGAYDDFNSTMIGRFGNVVPGGSGDPQDEGWPLGLRTEFNAFTFALPTVANSMYWRAEIINETEQVYGVGLDYEKLYVGYTLQPIRSQESSFYTEVWRGAILTAEGATGNPQCPGAAPPGFGFIDCAGDQGFGLGVTGHVVLKSPIGDLRNVLLTCDPAEGGDRAANRAIPCPTNAFNDPSNPHAGDTITYNHMVMCPYGGTCGSQTLLGNDRQMFGALASNVEDVLNGRDLGSVAGDFGYTIFRNPNYPTEAAPFSYWVPGDWDYTANGETPGGDTIFVPGCYGPPGVVIEGTTRENRADACAVTWSDTMPIGELGNPAYNNQEGNVSYWSVGPFALAAGDTTALVIALVAQGDSASFEAELNAVIDLYMTFYLSPEPPPRVNVVGVDVQVEDPSLGAGRGEVTLYWDDANNPYRDEFLWNFADALDEAEAGELLDLKTWNPTLVDDIRARAEDNLEEIQVFKSCDNGNTFTTNDTDGRGLLDCDGDPAQDVSGRGIAPGWQAYSILPVDDSGNAPNTLLDQLVIPGQTYLYSFVGVSRGASFPIVRETDPGVFIPDSLVLAPSLSNPLSVNTDDPNVVQVYVPASIQAGSQTAAALVTPDLTGYGTGEFAVGFTGSPVVEDEYVIAFANEFEVVTERDAEGVILNTTVTAEDVIVAEVGGAAEDATIDELVLTTENPNGVQIAGDPDVLVAGNTTTETLDAFGIVLYRAGTSEPLLVSTELDGENTTPSTFFARQSVGSFTGFPGFVVNVDDSEGGDYDRQQYQVAVDSTDVPNQVTPTMTWDQQSSVENQGGGISAYGQYNITFTDFTFGPFEPFDLNFANPAVTEEDVQTSLASRAVGSTGRTDAEAAAAIAEATGLSVTEADLVAVTTPFTVRNALYGRDVDVAMLARSDNTILLGDVGTQDTLTVEIDPTTWVPGDELYFLETVELDSIGASGGVMLDGQGQPIQVQRLAATFAPAVLSCTNFPRESCNPVRGAGTTLDWVTNIEGQNLAVFYIAPYQLESELSFTTQAAIVGDDVLDNPEADITSKMDSIHTVPNPYIIFSRYEVDTPADDDARIMFTHLPPEGTLRIFTVAGQFVQEIQWTPDDLAGNGDLFWNVRTREGNEAGSGLYIFVVEAVNPATGGTVKKVGKFVVIR